MAVYLAACHQIHKNVRYCNCWKPLSAKDLVFNFNKNMLSSTYSQMKERKICT